MKKTIFTTLFFSFIMVPCFGIDIESSSTFSLDNYKLSHISNSYWYGDYCLREIGKGSEETGYRYLMIKDAEDSNTIINTPSYLKQWNNLLFITTFADFKTTFYLFDIETQTYYPNISFTNKTYGLERGTVNMGRKGTDSVIINLYGDTYLSYTPTHQYDDIAAPFEEFWTIELVGNGKTISLTDYFDGYVMTFPNSEGTISFDLFTVMIFERSRLINNTVSAQIHRINLKYQGLTTNSTPLFEKPDPQSKHITVLKGGETCDVTKADSYTITSEYEDYWYYVKTESESGWVEGKNILIEGSDWKERNKIRGKYLIFEDTQTPGAATNTLPKTAFNILKAADNLRLRKSELTSSEIITTMLKGTSVKIIATGRQETIDGISATWVLVEVQPGGKDRNGNPIPEGTTGWCFGGYLE